MGDARPAAAAKAIAYRLDPHAVVDRAARAAADRTVSIRPAPDTAPAQIYGYGPIPAAVARELVSCAVGDQRSRATLRLFRSLFYQAKQADA